MTPETRFGLLDLHTGTSPAIAQTHGSMSTVLIKNLTLSVDDQVLATVRQHAAETETSVNAMVREFLQGVADKKDRARRARQRIRELSEDSQGRVGERTWSRDELHAR